MPVSTNIDLLNAFDNNEQVQSAKLNVTDEHAGQVVAMEILRELKAVFALVALNIHFFGEFLLQGPAVEAYNTSTPEELNVIAASGLERAKRHPTAAVHLLTSRDLAQAKGLAESFFEHGYTTIMDALSMENKCTFRRQG